MTAVNYGEPPEHGPSGSGAFSCEVACTLSTPPSGALPPGGKTRLHIFIDPSSAVGLIADVARDILPLIIFRYASLLELSRALFIRSDACRLAPLRRGFFS